MTTPTQHTPYGTPESPRLAVRGEARLEVEPELARISITVSARGTDRRAALDDLGRRNAGVLELIRSYGEAVEKLETGAFVITPQWSDKGRGERIRAYHGRVNVTAALADFTALGELVTRLGDLELTSVGGPWWQLRTDSPVRGEARCRAVREAVLRAREYAGALGAELVALVELADEGAETTGGPAVPAAAGGAFYGRSAARAEAAAPLDLEPQRQTVYAHVNARFTMSPPDLGE
ncbi:MAG TPA: hypothetical protein DEQ61_21335 [Streptomyces sp.]|nr:hypothetical protein [Streptomyces sp.]